MKKIITKLPHSSDFNYLKIETTGLSKDKDNIIALSTILKNKCEITTLVVEDLKDEEKIVEFFSKNLSKNKFITFNGKSFDGPFLEQKILFYFENLYITNFFDVQKLARKYNYLLKVPSYSNDTLLKFFNIEPSKINGRDINKLYKTYLKGDKTSLQDIARFSIESIKNLQLLHDKLTNFIKENLSICIDNYKFETIDMELIKNQIILTGKTNYPDKLFSSNELFNLDIEKDFLLEINTENLPYDEDYDCYFVRKSNYGKITNKSSIKSPKEILILYYKNYCYENILSLAEFIIRKTIVNN
ncbi:hypothetical protein ABID14_001790 [Peptoniphilus olsenii]|uniref:YprB ribonuclease H-like domain-containing protein n=1 Tax=Peptoniphilus olsenii TaxID=411570 RepID=A0ABV2JE22_9FIRM